MSLTYTTLLANVTGDDHDYALPLQEELQAVDEPQDPDPLSLSPHDVLVVQMDDCQTDANTSQQISSTGKLSILCHVQ